jgi:DNA transposition AAA+ family ATPase
MLRDDQPLTPEITAEILRRFQELLARIKRTQDWAGRSMAISPTTISSIINGTFEADPEKHIRAIDKWLETQYLKEHAPRPSGFVKTEVARRIYAAAKVAIESSGIVLVHGPAGIGKSITAQAIRAETPGSIFTSISTAGLSKIAVMELIAQQLRVSARSTSAQMFDALRSALRDTGRLLIVDEVHKLEGRRKDEALHCLRDLHDQTGIPMLWLGMSNIADYIQRGESAGYERLDQLFSRITLWLNLTEIANRADGGPGLYSVEDIQKILAGSKLRITPDGARYLQMLANEYGAGALRTVSKLLQLAPKFIRDDRDIDAEFLRSLQVQRLGLRAAERLETRMQARLAVA